MTITTLRFQEHPTKLNSLKSGSQLFTPTPGEMPSMLQSFPTYADSPLPWFEIAEGEEIAGVEEVAGSRHNPRIIEYHATTTL